jgi:hypothetical protein
MLVHINEQKSVDPCACGTWLEHWQKYSGERLPALCSAMACPCTPAVGAVVRMTGGFNELSYIVPLCMEHGAQRGQAIELIPGARLVLATARPLCRESGVRV